jgi:hypothetical protein
MCGFRSSRISAGPALDAPTTTLSSLYGPSRVYSTSTSMIDALQFFTICFSKSKASDILKFSKIDI